MKTVTKAHIWERGCCALFLYIILCPLFSGAQVQTQKAIPNIAISENINGYYESLPVDYSSNPSKKYPLLIFMHGNGERGDGSAAQLPRVLVNGPPKLINQGKFPPFINIGGENFSFIVISPQSKESSTNPKNIANLIQYCISNYRVDEDRI